MNIADLDGRALAVWLTDEANESVVFVGTARWNGSILLMERENHQPFEIRAEWHERVRAVSDEGSRNILLGAGYYLRLFVRDLPRDEAEDGYEKTGLKWPE